MSVLEYDDKDDDEDEEDEESEDDGETFAAQLRLNRKSLQKLIKTFFSWYPWKQGTPLWDDGDSIESEYTVTPLISKSIYTPTHQKYDIGRHFILFQKSEVTKAFNWKNFQDKSLVIVLY